MVVEEHHPLRGKRRPLGDRAGPLPLPEDDGGALRWHTVVAVAAMKAQAKIKPGDVCSVCGATVRRVPVSEAGIDEVEHGVARWLCGCPGLDGPQVVAET